MHIEIVSEATGDLYEALQRLVPQLGAHKLPPTREELQALLRSECSRLLTARHPDDQGPIVGILCLAVYRVPTGLRSIIEDVIVDENMRRQGIGEALMRRALEMARELGADSVSLTSHPRREAANRLYQSMGFELRKTNPYLYRLK